MYIVLRCEGEVCADDFKGMEEDIYSKIDDDAYRYQIVDLAGVTKVDMSVDELRKFAEGDKAAVERSGPVVAAFVAPSDLTYGLSRMFETLLGGSGAVTSVFRDFEAAREWVLAQRSH